MHSLSFLHKDTNFSSAEFKAAVKLSQFSVMLHISHNNTPEAIIQRFIAV